jgi:hypothetical protein
MSNPATNPVHHPVPEIELFQFVYDAAGHMVSASNTDKSGVKRSVQFSPYPKQDQVIFNEDGKPSFNLSVFITNEGFKILAATAEYSYPYDIAVAGPEPGNGVFSFLVNGKFGYSNAVDLASEMSRELGAFAADLFTLDVGAFSMFADVFKKASLLVNPNGLNPALVENKGQAGTIPNVFIWGLLALASAMNATAGIAPFLQGSILFFCGVNAPQAFADFNISPSVLFPEFADAGGKGTKPQQQFQTDSDNDD